MKAVFCPSCSPVFWRQPCGHWTKCGGFAIVVDYVFGDMAAGKIFLVAHRKQSARIKKTLTHSLILKIHAIYIPYCIRAGRNMSRVKG